MTTKMYTYKRERAKRLYPDPAIFNRREADEGASDTRGTALRSVPGARSSVSYKATGCTDIGMERAIETIRETSNQSADQELSQSSRRSEQYS